MAHQKSYVEKFGSAHIYIYIYTRYMGGAPRPIYLGFDMHVGALLAISVQFRPKINFSDPKYVDLGPQNIC